MKGWGKATEEAESHMTGCVNGGGGGNEPEPPTAGGAAADTEFPGRMYLTFVTLYLQGLFI